MSLNREIGACRQRVIRPYHEWAVEIPVSGGITLRGPDGNYPSGPEDLPPTTSYPLTAFAGLAESFATTCGDQWQAVPLGRWPILIHPKDDDGPSGGGGFAIDGSYTDYRGINFHYWPTVKLYISLLDPSLAAIAVENFDGRSNDDYPVTRGNVGLDLSLPHGLGQFVRSPYSGSRISTYHSENPFDCGLWGCDSFDMGGTFAPIGDHFPWTLPEQEADWDSSWTASIGSPTVVGVPAEEPPASPYVPEMYPPLAAPVKATNLTHAVNRSYGTGWNLCYSPAVPPAWKRAYCGAVLNRPREYHLPGGYWSTVTNSNGVTTKVHQDDGCESFEGALSPLNGCMGPHYDDPLYDEATIGDRTDAELTGLTPLPDDPTYLLSSGLPVLTQTGGDWDAACLSPRVPSAWKDAYCEGRDRGE